MNNNFLVRLLGLCMLGLLLLYMLIVIVHDYGNNHMAMVSHRSVAKRGRALGCPSCATVGLLQKYGPISPNLYFVRSPYYRSASVFTALNLKFH